jgi:argininosuccinate lyase
MISEGEEMPTVERQFNDASKSAASFPHPVYAAHILRPAFEDARRLLFAPMLAANAAHLVMLAETGVVGETEAGRALAALREIAEGGADAFQYAAAVEDLFFAIERRLIVLAGPEAGGCLQTARSRNDLDAAMCRLMLRELVLGAVDQTLALRSALLDLARVHLETLMPGTTHTQPAQPTTLAHYLGGVLGPLERDTERLRQLYGRVNRNPLGVAAFTTTGFPIDRELTARLLGFEGLVENGYDAVGAADHMLEATGALVTAAASLSRFVHDLLIWARPETGVIRIADAFVQISSIMPQKRNPVVLEHVRARIGYVFGDAATVATMVHSSAFGDTVDVEDEIYVPLARCFAAMASVLDLLTAVMSSIEIDRGLLAARAGQGFTTSTELADTLVRVCGLPFRTAHAIAARVVQDAIAAGKGAGEVTAAMVDAAAQDVAGRPLAVDAEVVRAALDPWRFVRARTGPGGPAPETTRRAFSAASRRLSADRGWLAGARERLAGAEMERARRAERLIAQQAGRES